LFINDLASFFHSGNRVNLTVNSVLNIKQTLIIYTIFKKGIKAHLIAIKKKIRLVRMKRAFEITT